MSKQGGDKALQRQKEKKKIANLKRRKIKLIKIDKRLYLVIPKSTNISYVSLVQPNPSSYGTLLDGTAHEEL